MADLSQYDLNDPKAPWNQGDYLQLSEPITRKQYWALSDEGLQNTPLTSGELAKQNNAQSNKAWSNSWIARGAYEKAAAEKAAADQQVVEQPAPDAYLTALYSLMGKNTADTSGYDAALGNISTQRTQAAKRYQTYTAQLSDLFGNLGRKSDTYAKEQANIGQNAGLLRSQVTSQQAEQSKQTRAADAARLNAANEARKAAGLGDAALAGAGGDFGTQQSEAAISDQQRGSQTTIDTILANEALAKLMSSNQAAGFDIAGSQAQQQLNMSYEDMLASLANQESQTKIQKSQAVSAGAMSPSEQIAILNAAKNYTDAQANTGTSGTDPATVWMTANPNSAGNAQALLSTFVPWFTTSAPSTDEKTGKAPTLFQLVNAYSKAHAEGADIIAQDPTLYNLIQVYTGIK